MVVMMIIHLRMTHLKPMYNPQSWLMYHENWESLSRACIYQFNLKQLRNKSLRALYSSKGLFVTRTSGVVGLTLNMPLMKAGNVVDHSSVPSVHCIDFSNFCLTHNKLLYFSTFPFKRYTRFLQQTLKVESCQSKRREQLYRRNLERGGAPRGGKLNKRETHLLKLTLILVIILKTKVITNIGNQGCQ